MVWFPESNRWVEFMEPAWFIYEMHEKGENASEITEKLTERYGLPEDEARRFYREIVTGIEYSANPPNGGPAGTEDGSGQQGKVSAAPGKPRGSEDPAPEKISEEAEKTAKPEPSPSRSRRFVFRHYLVNEKHITISYGSPLTEYYIHRPLAHLETVSTGGKALLIKLYKEKGGSGAEKPDYTVTVSPPGRRYRFGDAGFLRHRVYTEICNHIYGIPEQEWMSYIHASAVTDGREAVLLSSASGSGKSTMAALLQLPAKAGFTPAEKGNPAQKKLFFMSDDFVPVAAATLKAYPFPAAITVKEGSFEVIAPFYNPGQDADAGYGGLKNRKVRYLRPVFPEREPFVGRPVKNIVFIRHNPQVNFLMEKLDTLSALAAFHREAWVSQNPGHARSFIDWFVGVDCYALEYSDNKKAVKAIGNLFGKP